MAALAWEPMWQPLPPRFWGRQSPFRMTALVGERGDFRWYAVQASDARRGAVSAARRLLHRGVSAGVLGFSARRRTLTLTVSFGDLPVLELDLRTPGSVALAALAELARPFRAGPLACAAEVARILSGEQVGRRFFASFDEVLRRLQAGISGLADPTARHSLALLLLTRVLFLYFLQAKGWLDGREDFLRREVDRCLCRGGNIHRHLLKPLFFGTLNRRPEDRPRTALGFGRIPFLNGGLFEPHPLERSWGGTLGNHLWRAAFDDLFERFRFTASEGAAGPAIAPDMLGRVFEGVMDPAARRSTGTYYTPPELVQELFDAALDALLRSRGFSTGPATLPAAARAILRDLTILDPAVGSGAFLLGALARLTELRRDELPVHLLRREVLTRNLFGVDLNPTAVRLTELRLWLAVVGDDPAEDPGDVAPLPNLDCLIRQGDSLVDPLGALARLPGRPQVAGAALAGLRRQFALATGTGKRAAARALRGAEIAAMRESLDAARGRVEGEVRECLASARASDLFGTRRGLDTEHARRLAALRARLRALRADRRRLTRDGEVPWFQFEAHFADVFATRNGFDLVIGNPPWVRAEELPRVVRERLSRRYRWWRAGGTCGFRHQPDLAVAFLERAHELAAPDGVVGLLVPSKIASAGYAATARRALATERTIHLAADLAGRAGAFDATVYPMALVTGNGRADPGHRVALRFRGGSSVPQRELAEVPWPLRGTGAARAVARMIAGHPCLGETLPVRLGAKSGADDLFLRPPEDVEPDCVRSAVHGRDLAPFRIERLRRLLWPCADDGRPLPSLPPRTRRFLAEHEPRLRARADFTRGPWWALFRTGAGIPADRVVWADLSRCLTAVPLTDASEQRIVALNTCYLVTLPDGATARRLAAWLNSTWLRAAARSMAVPARGGFVRHNARTVSALPLPPAVLADPLLDRFARRAVRHPWNQQELDELTGRHLDLTPASRTALRRLAGFGADHRG